MTAFIYNVTFDARDPQALGRFWARATGYEITVDEPDFVRLRAPDERGVRHILFFKVDDPTPGKNRTHVDLASKDPLTTIADLVDAGASLVDDGPVDEPTWRPGGGTKWVVMQDPEGNEFCIG